MNANLNSDNVDEFQHETQPDHEQSHEVPVCLSSLSSSDVCFGFLRISESLPAHCWHLSNVLMTVVITRSHGSVRVL